MKIRTRRMATAVAASLAMLGLSHVAAAADSDDQRAEIEALQKRLAQLESRTPPAPPTVPAWVSKMTWKGDLRVRGDSLDLEYAPDRNRIRIRARAGFEAKVNDTVRTEFALSTTEGGDPRASNQTLTGENSRKPILLDIASVEWSPHADWKFIAGKMRYPLIRPGQSLFIDGDVNPEGLAATWTHGDFFAGALYNVLEERSAAAESTEFGSQVAWRPRFGKAKLSVGASYYAFSHVQGRSPFHNGAANGNSTTTAPGACIDTSPCLVNDYDILELFAEWSLPVAGRPLAMFADYALNTTADNQLDTARGAGISWGKASDPRTWEVGIAWQQVEKDALYAQHFDSDYANGLTDSRGSIFRAAYAPARNWVINATWFLNETAVDVPVTVTGVGAVQGRAARRLQLDLNFKY
jgi:hypothetical protein